MATIPNPFFVSREQVTECVHGIILDVELMVMSALSMLTIHALRFVYQA